MSFRQHHGRLGPRMDVEFFIDIADVGADGAEADGQMVGNFLIPMAFGEQS